MSKHRELLTRRVNYDKSTLDFQIKGGAGGGHNVSTFNIFSLFRCTRKRTRTFAMVQVGYQSTDGPVTVLQMVVMMSIRTYKPHQMCTSQPVTNSCSSMSIFSPISFIMEGMGAECNKKWISCEPENLMKIFLQELSQDYWYGFTF